MKQFALCSLFLCVCFACHHDDMVDPGVKQYMNRFQDEAESRNIKIDFDSNPVEVRLETHENEVALGWCNHDLEAPSKVTINSLFWSILDDFEREKLVFHELGHCVLGRPHLDRIRGDGYCQSLMHSGQACADNYDARTRDTYLDELFSK